MTLGTTDTAGRMERVYDMSVGEDISSYMGQIFETMCQSWLIDHMDRIPFQLGSIGEWWGNHPEKRRKYGLILLASKQKRSIEEMGNVSVFDEEFSSFGLQAVSPSQNGGDRTKCVRNSTKSTIRAFCILDSK